MNLEVIREYVAEQHNEHVLLGCTEQFVRRKDAEAENRSEDYLVVLCNVISSVSLMTLISRIGRSLNARLKGTQYETKAARSVSLMMVVAYSSPSCARLRRQDRRRALHRLVLSDMDNPIPCALDELHLEVVEPVLEGLRLRGDFVDLSSPTVRSPSG